MKTFDELWDWVMKRTERGVMTVQERSELEHVFNLMKDCECGSYLEVGTAEGNSLYVLGHAVNGYIQSIDLAEQHTRSAFQDVWDEIHNTGIKIDFYPGDSTWPTTHPRDIKFDCVLIDGGHDFATVLSDALLYAPLATKYVFFHDIQLPEVKAAVEWFIKRWKLGRYYTYVNSPSFGYGIIEVGK